jgi:uncharacterized protein with HEPN domain
MRIETRKRLLDALNACRAIAEFIAGQTFMNYEGSLLRRSAVERQLEIIGEAMGKLLADNSTLIEQVPQARRIVGLRNRIIHGYDTVDNQIVWDIVQTELPELTEQLTHILSED